jgi:(p)ppGpp synthase/HD superfamily hydrolase
MIDRARVLATKAHKGQYRKKTGADYIVHPAKVARLVQENGGSEAAITAAWLHDVKEDCAKKWHEHIDLEFPPEVVTLVDAMTRIKDTMSKSQYLKAFRNHPPEAMLIKLADRWANLNDGKESLGDDWLRNYMKSTKLILKIAKEKGLESSPLYQNIQQFVDDFTSQDQETTQRQK